MNQEILKMMEATEQEIHDRMHAISDAHKELDRHFKKLSRIAEEEFHHYTAGVVKTQTRILEDVTERDGNIARTLIALEKNNLALMQEIKAKSDAELSEIREEVRSKLRDIEDRTDNKAKEILDRIEKRATLSVVAVGTLLVIAFFGSVYATTYSMRKDLNEAMISLQKELIDVQKQIIAVQPKSSKANPAAQKKP